MNDTGKTQGRERANSVNSIQDYFKRKKNLEDPAEFEKGEKEFIALKKGTKIKKKPQKESVARKRKAGNMEEIILKKLEEMGKDLKAEINNKHTEMKAEFTKLNEKFNKAKIEWERKAAEWKREKETLEKRIGCLENKMEKQEQDKRRNNIVIKGIAIEEGRIKEEVERLIQDKLKFTSMVQEGYAIKGRDDTKIIIAKLSTWEEKRKS